MYIYLSPHLDDAALSCGGLIWQQSQAGEDVAVWTVCSSDPPRDSLSPFARVLHQRWGTGSLAAALRRAEDMASCAEMGAVWRHLPFLDCIYRKGEEGQPLYTTEEALSGPLHPSEAGLIRQLTQEIASALPAQAVLICPLALGNHVDHQLTRTAAEALGRPLWFYADYPYVRHDLGNIARIEAQGWQMQMYPISAAGLEAWQQAVAEHASQLSTFWLDLQAMREAIQSYCEGAGGVRLWKPSV